VRWKILFYRIPQFIYESKSAKVIVKIKVAPFLMAHGVCFASSLGGYPVNVGMARLLIWRLLLRVFWQPGSVLVFYFSVVLLLLSLFEPNKYLFLLLLC